MQHSNHRTAALIASKPARIMTSAALEHGMTLAAALGAICYAVQKFVGTPISSYYGIREARILIE